MLFKYPAIARGLSHLRLRPEGRASRPKKGEACFTGAAPQAGGGAGVFSGSKRGFL